MATSVNKVELLKYYRDYISSIDQCKSTKQIANTQRMWELSFETMNRSLLAVKQMQILEWQSVAHSAFRKCFEEPQDQTAFYIAHSISLQASDRAAILMVDGCQSFNDKPSRVHVSRNSVHMLWEQSEPSINQPVAHRDIDLGPAFVLISGNTSCRGKHFVNGAHVSGHKNWRSKCKQHNRWLQLVDGSKGRK